MPVIKDKSRAFYPIDLNGKITVQDIVDTVAEIGGSSGSMDEFITKLDSVEQVAFDALSALVEKAHLVSGKVPYEQLPSFPVGRKIKVANAAERLTLEAYPDLTIAYEQDTADAWALNPNDDPSIPANWSKLGNTQAVGVITFNGRAGNIAPEPGDYHAGLITETLNRRFVSPEQIALWNSAPNPELINIRLAEQKVENDALYETKQNAENLYVLKTSLPPPVDLSTYMLKSSRDAIGGVAPLDAKRKLPSANLNTNVAGGVPILDGDVRIPSSMLPKRVWVDRTASRQVGTWYVNTSPNEMEVHIYTTRNNNAGYLTIEMQETTTSATLRFSGNTTQDYTGLNTRCFVNVTVPAGWRYSLNSADFGSRVLTRWNELS